MVTFAIIEEEDGLTIAQVDAEFTPEEAAMHAGGRLVDAGPYASYQDALDAIDDMTEDNDELRISPAVHHHVV